MKGAVETMVGIVFMTFMAVLGTGYIIASLNTQSAQHYHAAVIAEIESADLADSVIQSCEEKALENGYKDLTIQKVEGNMGAGAYAKVTLTYDYTIPLLNMLLEHEIVGYAR